MDRTTHSSQTCRAGAVATPPRLRFAPCAAAALALFGAPAAMASVGCLPGTWSNDGITNCQAADPGYYVALPGATSQTPAPVGKYVSTAGATTALDAPVGTYVDQPGQSAAKLADPGYYVPTTGASAQTAAPLGKYVPFAGSASAFDAPVGTYVDHTGQSAAKPADPGYYVPTAGASAQTAALPGSYVATAGASAAMLALPGTFVGTAAATAATLAPAGYYVSSLGATAATAAPAGRYVANAGQTSANACAAGSYSYGAASACRGSATGDVGPVFGSVFGTGGPHDLGSLAAGQLIALGIVNATLDDPLSNPGGKLTALTLIGAVLGGANSSLFELLNFTPGEVLQKGDLANISLLAHDGGGGSPFSITLNFATDQGADFGLGTAPGSALDLPSADPPGGAGQLFSFTFTGTLASAPAGVPEPMTPALVLAALGALGGLRWRAGRRCAAG